MSITAALWVASAVVLVLLSFLNRPSWAVALYMLTFFAAPHMYWWGRDVPVLRYALLAGIVLMVAVALHRSSDSGHRMTVVHATAIGMALNATLVQFVLAPPPTVGIDDYIEQMKLILLFFMIASAIHDKRDFRVVLLAIALGAGYLGYEVTINDRGTFSGSRLEDVGTPGAHSSNGLACLLLVVLPLIGSLFVDTKPWQKLVVVVSAPLALNVLLLCNSRGAFLGLIGSALVFLLIARGPTRKRALQTIGLGAVALYLLLGDPKILDRFATTFVGSEERDNSAASRLAFWKAGLAMLSDYPLGAGGGAFKYVHGGRYLAEVGVDEERSLHNGYLTEATSWGLQGLFLQLLLLGGAMVAAYGTSKRCRLDGRADNALIGICVIVATTGLLITSIFGSFLSKEWGFWVVALLVRYSQLYAPVESEVAEVSTPVAA